MLNDKQRFEIITGAILTQNTSWKNVEKAIGNLNKAKLIDIDRIIKIKKQKLANLIKPAGYYNQKAERLKIIAEFIKKNPNPAREQLLEVKGIGPETADSILLYAFNRPFFVIDAYTKRIFVNLGFIDEKADYDKIKKLFEDNLKPDPAIYQEYHALLVEHAKRYYAKKGEYHNCPLYRRFKP